MVVNLVKDKAQWWKNIIFLETKSSTVSTKKGRKEIPIVPIQKKKIST